MFVCLYLAACCILLYIQFLQETCSRVCVIVIFIIIIIIILVIRRFLFGAGLQDRVCFRRQLRAQLSLPAHFDHYSAL